MKHVRSVAAVAAILNALAGTLAATIVIWLAFVVLAIQARRTTPIGTPSWETVE